MKTRPQFTAPMMRSHRRGTLLVLVLSLLAIIAILSVILLQGVLAMSWQSRRAIWRTQAEALAEAGQARARARVAQQSDYTGETWLIPKEELDGRSSGRVEIKAQANPQRIEVRALFPDRETERAQVSLIRNE